MKILTYEQNLPDSAKVVRKTVFEEEQGFVDEFDDTDDIATHFVMLDENEQPIATCRVFKDASGENQAYILGRLAVCKEYRHNNIGSLMMQEAEKYIRNVGGKSISLHAQCQASGFYGKNGYVQCKEIDDEQGCPHVWMKKILAEKE
ncbi:MAG: GNAT family N-acetyltransferase [Lachnospiraceae bacterium]|nr:GNAT family N-acetyltransferase [Lachnospiraceae bacterium]